MSRSVKSQGTVSRSVKMQYVSSAKVPVWMPGPAGSWPVGTACPPLTAWSYWSRPPWWCWRLHWLCKMQQVFILSLVCLPSSVMFCSWITINCCWMIAHMQSHAHTTYLQSNAMPSFLHTSYFTVPTAMDCIFKMITQWNCCLLSQRWWMFLRHSSC